MSINLITGYDINRDECGESRNTASHSASLLFNAWREHLRSQTTRLPLPLEDESETEWLYNQKRNKGGV